MTTAKRTTEDSTAAPAVGSPLDRRVSRPVPEQDTYCMPPHGWTCFHCGETFTTTGSAATHFGATPDAQPGCMVRVQLGPERGLLMALRKAEEAAAKAWSAVHEETTEAHRAMHAMQSRHAQALEDATELGYADGLRDARAEAATRCAIHSQYPITTEYDRGYDKGRQDAAEAVRHAG